MNHTDRSVLVSARNLSVHFSASGGWVLSGGKIVVRAVDDVDMDIIRHETLGLVGESGSGKTTLGQAMMGLAAVTSGTVLFDGVPISGLDARSLFPFRRRMQAVFQDPYSSLHPRCRVGAIVREPLDIHNVGTLAARRQVVDELLGAVGLAEEFAQRYPNELSGGQRQRVGIARALALGPEFIVADEPVSALDVSVQAQILNLLKKLQRDKNLTILLISHNLGVVQHLCDRVAVMYFGRIVEVAPTEQLFSRPAHPYTLALMSATLDWQEAPEDRLEPIVLKGEIPRPTEVPEGCPFAGRCWFRETLSDAAICATTKPGMRDIGPGHRVACHFAERLQESELEPVQASQDRANS